MPSPPHPNMPVTRAEFVSAWNGVRTVARHVDELKKAYGLMLRRLEHLDRQMAELSAVVDELTPKRMDA